MELSFPYLIFLYLARHAISIEYTCTVIHSRTLFLLCSYNLRYGFVDLPSTIQTICTRTLENDVRTLLHNARSAHNRNMSTNFLIYTAILNHTTHETSQSVTRTRKFRSRSLGERSPLNLSDLFVFLFCAEITNNTSRKEETVI